MKEEVLKQLIKEMEWRLDAFKFNREANKEVDGSHAYWDGKHSEAQFIVKKLTRILNTSIKP